MAKQKPELNSTEGAGDAAAMNPEAAAADAAAMNPEAPAADVPPADVAAMNPEAPAADVPPVDVTIMNPEVAPAPEQQPVQVNVMTAPVTLIQTAPAAPVTPPLPQGTAEAGKYEEFLIMPDATWPPPIFMKKTVSAQERFYIETRWHSQWQYYDRQATRAKNSYFLIQRIVVLGSLMIPALVSLNSTISRFIAEAFFLGSNDAETLIRIIVDTITVIISLSVAGAAAIESLYKHGDNWSSYRAAAEELQAEKYFYDMLSGPYNGNTNSFGTFVERTEGIVAKQTGQYFQVFQAQIQKQAAQNEDLIERFKASADTDAEEEVAAAG